MNAPTSRSARTGLKLLLLALPGVMGCAARSSVGARPEAPAALATSVATPADEPVAAAPDTGSALAREARLRYAGGDIEGAIALIAPLAARPDAPPAIRVDLAVLKMAYGDREEAKALLEQTIAAHPDCAAAHGNLGLLHLENGDLAPAAAALTTALARDPERPEFHLNLGIVHRKRGQHAAAAEDFQRALALAPGYAAAQYNLALLYKLYLFDDAAAAAHFAEFSALGGRADPEVALLFASEEKKP